MVRRWFALCAVIIVAVVGSADLWVRMTTRPPAHSFAQPGPLILVGVPRLTIYDNPTARESELWQMSRDGATGGLLTRNLNLHSCSNQSWLTLSAGTRTSIGRGVPETPEGSAPKPCPTELTPKPAAGGGAYFPAWKSWRKTTLGRASKADIGRLGSTLAAHGECISAAGPYAALGAADHNGRVAAWTRDPHKVDLRRCPVTFIGLRGPDDTYLTWLRARAPANATIVVAGMADDRGPERLHAVVMVGPQVPHGLLTSDAVRQPGILQTTDLSALVLARVGTSAPHLAEGRIPLVQASGSSTAPAVRVVEYIRVLAFEHAFVSRFFIIWYAVAIPLVLLCGWWGRRSWTVPEARPHTTREMAREFAALVAASSAAMPVASFIVTLVPWWRARHPFIALGGGIAVIAVVVALVALLGPWRRWRAGPIAFLCLGTFYVIGMDVIQGSRLQLVSLLGLQPIYGGRTYGVGNVAFALLATSALMLAAIVAGPYSHRGLHWRRNTGLALLTVAAIGAITITVDGYPTWGADGGGSIALVPAFGYLLLVAAGLRITFVRGILIGLAAMLVGAAVAIADYLRPISDRTHIGDAVARIRDHHDFSPVTRIWHANWTMLTSTPLNMCVPVLMIGAIALVARPKSKVAAPIIDVVRDTAMLYEGLVAVLIAWLFAFFSNDSGTAIPPSGMMLAVPLLILLAVTEGEPTLWLPVRQRR